MNYKGIVSRAIASSPELKKNLCLPLLTFDIRRKQSNTAEGVRRICRGSAPTFCIPKIATTNQFFPVGQKQFYTTSFKVAALPSGKDTLWNASYKRSATIRPKVAITAFGGTGGTGMQTKEAQQSPLGLQRFHTQRAYEVGMPKNAVSKTLTALSATWGTEAADPTGDKVGMFPSESKGNHPLPASTSGSIPSDPKVASPREAEGNKTKQAREFDQNTTDSLWDQKRPTYPFTAIVGQEEMKLALLLNVIDPKIGGVMIMGDRGTGKSTTVRALIDLLPTIEVVDNDPFNSHPSDAELMSQNVREQVLQGKSLKVIKKKTQMIDLPLGATEDRVCGTIDIERALSEGVKAFEPGLLAKANRGILYVDEVNLLDDHLVDILLDSAASGWNTVEREGISISHPARFILVGSGNPEEGELRPQLLDRFGMHAQIGTVREAELRVKIVEERANFDRSPMDFLALHIEKQKELADKIVAARHLLGAVNIDYDLRVKISQVCGQLNVDGLRGDIVTNRASQALAAFEARTSVTPQDIFRVIPLCLRHRLRKDPLEPIDSGNRVREVFKQVFGFMSE